MEPGEKESGKPNYNIEKKSQKGKLVTQKMKQIQGIKGFHNKQIFLLFDQINKPDSSSPDNPL